MSKLFGFIIDDGKNTSKTAISPVPQNNEDGTDYFLTSNFLNHYIDIEGVYKTEYDLIRRYREMSLHPEVDSALQDIVNEAIVTDTNDSPIQIELSNLNASDEIKNIIRKEFKYILELLDFDNKAQQIYRNWFVDGRLFYHKIIDTKKPQEGIQELRYVDALKMRHVRQEKRLKNSQINRNGFTSESDIRSAVIPEIEEYFVYNPQNTYLGGSSNTTGIGIDKGIKFARDSITYCTSGLIDRNKGTVLSWLSKAIKSLNQLRMIEDSIVIYRLTRSVERKAFYIDVGNLPPLKAQQYLRETMARYRNRDIYDPSTGEIKNGDRKFMSMMEDYWLPRRADGRATEIVNIPGGCFAMDTKVSLLDGRELSIREIENEMKNGKTLWTYSCDPITGKVVPGLISWAGVTQKSAQVIKLTLDNGEEIICTPEHKFVSRENGFVEAQNFKIGDSLMPLYRKKEKISNNSNDYEMIYDNEDKTWKFTHRVAANECKGTYSHPYKRLQDPEYNAWFRNRISSSWDEEARNKVSERSKKFHSVVWNDKNYVKWYKEQHRKNQKIEFDKKHFDFVTNLIKDKTTHQFTIYDVCDALNSDEEMYNLFVEINAHKSVPNCDVSDGFKHTIVKNLVKEFGYSSWTHFRTECGIYNHKITSIEWLQDPIEVGTLTIDDNEEIHGHHTFALSAGVFVKNSNLGELTDLNYFLKKLYKSLGVPESRIGGDSGFNLGRSSEILRDEVKFSKFVGGLRKRFSTMFSDMLRTQLILKNIITPEDWVLMSEHIQYDFKYDNHFAELKESELLGERLSLAATAEPYIGKYFSQDYVRRHVLRQTDQEIVEEDIKIKKEIEEGIIPDPSIPTDEMGNPILDPMAMENPVSGNNIQGDAGKIPVEPKVDTKAVKPPTGGEI